MNACSLGAKKKRNCRKRGEGLQKMVQDGVRASCWTHNIVIDGLFRNGRAEAGYTLFCDLKKNGWKKSDKKPVLNPELWERLLKALSKHEYEFIWVKGHAGHPENERCDRLAVAQSEKYAKK